MRNGNVLILAVTKISNSEAIQLGRNPGKLNINFLNGGSGGANWLHFNSIFYNPILDQIIISSRNLSEIIFIDHFTTMAESATDLGGRYNKGGDFLYRWGNPQSYNHGTDIDRKLFDQHYPYFIEPGFTDEHKIMLFNNGRDRSTAFSEVFIINPETDNPSVYTHQTGTAFGPISPDFIYKHPFDPSLFYSVILSSAQRLPNGNTLICEGINGRFFEINASEKIVWQYNSPINSATGNVATQGSSPPTFPNDRFRAIKYSANHPALSNKDLAPSDPIELNPNTETCNTLGVISYESSLVKLFPNPSKGQVKINTKSIINKVYI